MEVGLLFLDKSWTHPRRLRDAFGIQKATDASRTVIRLKRAGILAIFFRKSFGKV